MRITLRFEALDGRLNLPTNYNYILHGFIYNNLSKSFANKLYQGQYFYGKRVFKYFTFSRLFAGNYEYNKRKKRFYFGGIITFKMASLDTQLLEEFSTYLLQQNEIRLGNNNIKFVSIEVEVPVQYHNIVTIRTISPITIYSTDKTKYPPTKYYHPFEPEFSCKILENLQRKHVALYSEELHLLGSYIRPLEIKKEVVTKFKNTVIKGYDGIFELCLPQKAFDLAYNTGLGSKNSQGFGMFEVVK